MGISRGQIGLVAAAVLAVGGVWLHNRNQALEQFHGGIIKTLQTKGRQDGSGDFVCTKDDMAIRTDGHSVRYQRPYPSIRPSSMDQAVKEPNPIIAIFHPIKTSGIFNDQYAGPSEPLEVLKSLAGTAGEFCR
jgi:hypothetical protein